MATVTFVQPTTWAEALEARAAHLDAVAVAGGTDVLVDLNFDRLHPQALLDLSRVEELRAWDSEDATIRLGAGATYHDMALLLTDDLPALAAAARSVGSPPIRNRGTIGGNLGSASPAGDCHPPLLACGAEVELTSYRSSRTVPIGDFFVGPKRSVLRDDELITAVRIDKATGPQVFSKVGVRNAMVIAVCSFSLALHPQRRRVGTGIGSAGPVPLTATDAEAFLEGHLEETRAWDLRTPLSDTVTDRFATLVAGAARPIDDVRGSAQYRRHALAVLARRSLCWCWEEYTSSPRWGSPG